MKTRKFYGAQIDQVLKRIKGELGSEVHLLEIRKVRQPGFWGWFRPKQIEVAVAFEPSGDSSRAMRSDKNRDTVVKTSPSTDAPEQARGESWSSGRSERSPLPSSPREETIEFETGRGRACSSDRPNAVDILQQRLLEKGVPEHIAHQMARRSPRDAFDFYHSLPVSAKPIDTMRAQPIQVALVGPTGSGKTTTCAKLAAKLALGRDRKVGLITLDTFRIGAVEQLRTYARILDAPLEVVFAPEEMRRALKRLAHCELILIDSAGRGYQDETSVQRLGAFLSEADVDETHLVVSLATDVDDARAIFAAYRMLGYNRLIMTKMDETRRPGKALAFMEAAGVTPSYISTGQNVPDDVGLAGDVLSRALWEGGTGHVFSL